MHQLLLKNWYDRFLKEIKITKKLRIVSPFVQDQVIRKIKENYEFKNLELITRFNLRDFASGVSSLSALKFSVESEAKIYGIKNLHSKIYLFDTRLAIITSANLTNGGLLNNYECGLCVTDQATLAELHSHFNLLKNNAQSTLTLEMCDQWQSQLENLPIQNTLIPRLPDYGASLKYYDSSKSYYVKFFGTGKNRVPFSHSVKREIESGLCHYACGFPENKQPWQINSGDIIYMARMTESPKDYAIFGKAEAVNFVPGRDRFTEKEMIARPWKRNWPIYLRVRNGIFIDATLGDCVLLFDLMKALDHESFPTTKQRYDDGQRDINPKLSLARQPYVRLTETSVNWLEPKFQTVLDRFGLVDESYIQSLPQAPVSL